MRLKCGIDNILVNCHSEFKVLKFYIYTFTLEVLWPWSKDLSAYSYCRYPNYQGYSH